MPNIILPKTQDKWTIYGTSWCTPCKKLKSYLINNNIKHVYHDLGDMENVKNVIEYFKPITNNNKSVPMVFKSDKYIGGYSDTLKYINDMNC